MKERLIPCCKSLRVASYHGSISAGTKRADVAFVTPSRPSRAPSLGPCATRPWMELRYCWTPIGLGNREVVRRGEGAAEGYRGNRIRRRFRKPHGQDLEVVVTGREGGVGGMGEPTRGCRRQLDRQKHFVGRRVQDLNVFRFRSLFASVCIPSRGAQLR